ncbi:aldose 1-epimerase [Buttiauxella gaviniae]|uniref:aldose 1-epimerase n=1 Tax=Buttiauxella gaviniae TaxID=82990 RepID=UPI003BB51146
MTKLIEKSCGHLQLSVAPSLGGAIAALNWRGFPILRPLSPTAQLRANQCGSYPLIPWSNRIAQGEFSFAGQILQVKKNFGDSPHAIHGSGWLNAWHVGEESDNGLTLELEQPANESWPWPWRGTQVFELEVNLLRVTLSYHNTSDVPVPVGLGFHPFFADADQSEICFKATGVWLNDDDSLPLKEIEVPERWNYPAFRKPQFGSVDNCFTGWNGCAKVHWPARKITAVLSSAATNAVLFIPEKVRNVVAIEPVTHINNAINLLPSNSSNQAMKLVSPGECLCLSMEIRISDDA